MHKMNVAAVVLLAVFVLTQGAIGADAADELGHIGGTAAAHAAGGLLTAHSCSMFCYIFERLNVTACCIRAQQYQASCRFGSVECEPTCVSSAAAVAC